MGGNSSATDPELEWIDAGLKLDLWTIIVMDSKKILLLLVCSLHNSIRPYLPTPTHTEPERRTELHGSSHPYANIFFPLKKKVKHY